MDGSCFYRIFKYRLYPTRQQSEGLTFQLEEARSLYNAALQERRDAWKMQGKHVSYVKQAAQLKDIRDGGYLQLANYGSAQAILRRVNDNVEKFFRAIKRGEKAGYPRFKSAARFSSFSFPVFGDGCQFTDVGRLRIQGVGPIKIKLHRPIAGQIRQLILKRDNGKWYACFIILVEGKICIARPDAVGVDLGLHSFVALSTGELVDNPHNWRVGHARLRRSERRVARRNKASFGRRKALVFFRNAHARTKNRRIDFQHKLSRRLADSYSVIAVEDLGIIPLARGKLALGIADAAWGSFLEKLAYKVEETGGVLVRVNPRGTSQVCSQCLTPPDVRKTINDRVHHCSHCGLTLDRDVNAARNILRLGLSLAPVTWHSSACVDAEAREGVVTAIKDDLLGQSATPLSQ